MPIKPIALGYKRAPTKSMMEKRASRQARGYDAAWQKLRLRKLQANPLCECDACALPDIAVAAEVVDHIKPVATHPELRLEWSNLRSMSAQHHNLHTALTRNARKGFRS
jgi:5-methylcytosine-specific restriction protein A